MLKIIKVQSENSNYTSLIFSKPANFSYYPGQYIDLELGLNPPDPNSNIRAFTLASSPTEDYLMITYKRGFSLFKKKLEILNPNDKIKNSHPAGTFILDETSPVVFLAGGVGITPFRSMIKYATDQKLSVPITLIYSNSTADFVFQEELTNWQKIYPKLKIIYYLSNINGRLDQRKFHTLYPILSTKNDIFYIAGSASFVNDLENMLLTTGVDSTNIRTDQFDGY